jgi:hypothetical protein
MAYFISCSGEKTCVAREHTKVSNLESLTGFSDLYKARLELINLLDLKLNWDQTLPAYKLYNGRVFKKISSENWTKKDTNIIIVSALFGQDQNLYQKARFHHQMRSLGIRLRTSFLAQWAHPDLNTCRYLTTSRMKYLMMAQHKLGKLLNQSKKKLFVV